MSPPAVQKSYVAFLRGINVGGVIVKMNALKKAFEALKYENVRTLLASGNVIFETPQTAPGILRKTIETKLKQSFGRDISVIVRSIAEIEKLVKSEPFKSVTITPTTRLNVTFLADKPKKKLPIPYKSVDGNFKIIQASDTELCSVVKITPTTGTLDVMGFIEKQYGKNVTTRTWNTVRKLLIK